MPIDHKQQRQKRTLGKFLQFIHPEIHPDQIEVIHSVTKNHPIMSLRDSLSASMEPFRYKLEKFRERHPTLRFRSIRLMRKNMLLSQVEHTSALGEALAKMTSNSEAAVKCNGINVLFHIRTKHLEHANKFRNSQNPASSPGLHRFEVMVAENEIHSMSTKKRKLRFQLQQLQYLSADFEAVALIYYLESKMIQEGIMTEEQRLRPKSKLLKLTPKGEYYLNELRDLLCG